MKKYLVSFFVILFVFTIPFQAQQKVTAPDWSYDQTIYEVNLRQFTPSGTIKEFRTHLPRLKELGVGILWFMPLHPIGEINRKGTLGSYYSVKDYYGLDSSLGSKEEFQSLVKEIHKLGMHVIIDWVANHTSWDNELAKKHPEFYTKDSTGKFIPPVADWADVIDLNFENKGLWSYMSGAMEYWLDEYNIDGFRCDVAGMVPNEFWSYLYSKLSAHKKVFMLAEDESPVNHTTAFDMTYSWDMYHVFNEIAKGKKPVSEIFQQLQKEKGKYVPHAFRMRFITNHDENSWNGTEFERLGDGVKAFSVLAFTLPGMPLLYNGQEAELTKRLNFFERDPINWKKSNLFPFFKKLIQLKKEFSVLDAGEKGASVEEVKNSSSDKVVSFLRSNGKEKVFIVVNLSKENVTADFPSAPEMKNGKDYCTKKKVKIGKTFSVELNPWDYRILTSK
ncbi:MAG: alpha-amylase family glycosyl hydrolase [Ignavibacteria bacterium]|nr:alpha-amylase family glycosyl hydrolase [Ignavibacteria bacterium]